MSLAALFASLGTSATAVASAVRLPVELLERVDQRRQPLPINAAKTIASHLGVETGTVLGAAGLWVDSAEPRYLVPVPPDPSLYGDVLRQTGLFPTGPTPPVGQQSATGVWIATNNGTGNPGTGALVHLDRNTGALIGLVNLVHVGLPTEVVVDGNGKVWTIDEVDNGGFYVARVNPRLAAVELEVASGIGTTPKHLVHEPATDTIWASASEGLVKIDLATGLLGVTVALDSPAHAIAVEGLLYAVALSSGVGRLFEVDPATGTQLRVSTGTAFGVDTTGVAYDPGTDAFFVSDSTGGVNHVWRLPRASMLAAAFAISGADVNLQGMTEVVAGAGRLLFCDATLVGLTQVAAFYVVDPTTGAVLGQSNDIESSVVGRNAIFDGAWFWVSDDNGVLKLAPSDARVLAPAFAEHLDVPCRGLVSL